MTSPLACALIILVHSISQPVTSSLHPLLTLKVRSTIFPNDHIPSTYTTSTLVVQQILSLCFVWLQDNYFLLHDFLAALMMRIEDVVIKTILAGELHIASACKMFMPYSGNCFGKQTLLKQSSLLYIVMLFLPSCSCLQKLRTQC